MTEVDLMKVINHARAEQEGMGLGDDAVSFAHFSACRDRASIIDLMALEGAQTSKDYAIQFDGICPYKGYLPDSARIFQTGPMTDSIRKVYGVIFEAEDRAEAVLKPGIRANEIYEAMYKVVRDAGYEGMDMGGHGTGLTTHEPPSIDAWNEQLIEEGMVLSIEPWCMTEDTIFGIQDTYVVTKTGYYKIEGLRRDIIQVSHPFC
jgi:Xaa-Pro dipeptidase